MFNHRSNKKELMDDLSLHTIELKKNLDELEMYNQWLGGKHVLISSLNRIYQTYSDHFKSKKMIIGDLGCGSGDLIREIDKWANSKNLMIQLIGIDANPFMIRYAREKSTLHPNIQYKTLDIFSTEFSNMQFDIISLNSVCHHFNDDKLIQLLHQLSKQTRLAIIINDLQRHWLSYFAIRGITHLFPFSSLAKHDAPLSVLRAFQKQEIIHLLQKAHLNTYQIHWAWAFRWDILIELL